MKNKLSNKIMRDLAAAGFAEWDGDKDIYFWTATGRQEYAGNWRRVENYAIELASQIERIYGPLATVGIPGAAFGTVEIKLLDLPEVVQMVEAARQQAAAPTGREILSLYLADDNSNIVFDEPGRTATTANITGTIRQLIKWIRERTHNEKIRKQFAAELLAGAVFTFEDLAFAVYRSAEGKFYFWNGADESTLFETSEDASAAMLEFITEQTGTTEDDGLLFGVKRTGGGDYDVYLDGDYFDSTGELPAAAATLANWLYNEYKATPFGKLADKVVVLNRLADGDYMAVLQGRDDLVGGPFRQVAAEVLRVIAGLADDSQKMYFAGIFDDKTAKMKRLLTGIVQAEGGKYIVKTGAGDYRQFDNRPEAEAAFKAHFLSDKIFESALRSIMDGPPTGLFTPPAAGPHFYGIGPTVGGNWQIIDGEGESAGTFSTFTAALQAFFKLWKSRNYAVEAEAVNEGEARQVFTLYRWPNARYTFSYKNETTIGSLAVVRREIYNAVAAEGGVEILRPNLPATEADDGRLLLAGLYQNPPNEGGYTIAGASVRGGGKREVNVYKAAASVKLLADHVAEHAQHYPDPNGRVDLDIKTTGGAVFFGGQVMPFDGQFRVGADPASQRPDDMVIAAKMAFSGGGDRPEAARQVAGFYDFGDDGKTWFVSSELPGHIGRFVYSSAPVAAERAGKILVDYLHRLGVPGVKAWPTDDPATVIFGDGQVGTVGGPYDNITDDEDDPDLTGGGNMD